MIAAGLFTLAGMLSALAPVPRDTQLRTMALSLVCWVVAALCGLGVIS